MIKKGENPFFVRELETGYVVLGDTPEPGPVWKLGTEELNSDKYKPDENERD